MPAPDDWLKEHKLLYGNRPLTQRPRTPRDHVGLHDDDVWVSPIAEELIADFQQALHILAGVNPENREALAVAAGNYFIRRREIYEHIADLERIAGRKRTVLKRF